MIQLGDFAEDQVVPVPLTTHAAAGGAVAPLSAFEAADFRVYKVNSPTAAPAEKATANGLTVHSPLDSVTGLHLLLIDTSVDTGDAGFWQPGYDYLVVLTPDETVDGQTVVAVAATFSIENRSVRALYHADIQYTRDQANTQDEYTVTWFKNGVRLASGITSPTITAVKRADGTNLINGQAMTQVGTTGVYKYDATATSGAGSTSERMTLGEACLVVAGATIDGAARSFAALISRDSS